MIKSERSNLVAAALAAVVVAVAVPLGGCVVYEPSPYAAPTTYDRAWAAAIGAMQDQGVAISDQDRVGGVVRGTRGPIGVSAAVRTRADGRVQVEFNTTGPASDPGLVERISASYERRMGR